MSGSIPEWGRATVCRPTTTTWSPRSWSTPVDRLAAIDRLRRALDETEVAGIQTTLPFHRFVARHPGFAAADLSTDWVAEAGTAEAERRARSSGSPRPPAAAAAATAGVAEHGRRPAPVVPATSGWAAAARADAVDRWPR